MPLNNCDPELTSLSPVVEDQLCPKCGSEMEPIESHLEGLPMQQLQLCPGCYLVLWRDQDGLHVRQGVPMTNGAIPGTDGARFIGEPTEC